MTNERFTSQSWIDERVEVRSSRIGGIGTLAVAPISAGELVFRWGGVLFTVADIRAGKARPGSVAAVDDGLYLAASTEDYADPSDFTNHSCDPNLWMMDAVSLVARRDIVPGEELTGDYAMWEGDEEYVASWECRCGSRLCRGRVTGSDWRLRELQERYRGHFSPFINRRIAALPEN